MPHPFRPIASMRVSGGKSSGARVTRALLGPLLLNHILILLGAFLVVFGVHGSSTILEIVGSALLSVGIAIEAAVVAWSAALIGRSAAGRNLIPANARPGFSGAVPRLLLCPRCSDRLPAQLGRCCPRCGHPLVIAV